MRRFSGLPLVLLGLALATPLRAETRREAAQKALKTLTTSKNAEDRASAAETLGSLGATDAVPALGAALRDSDDDVRASAAYSLWELHASAGPARAALRAAVNEESDGRTILNEAATLESLGVDLKDLVPALERAMRDPDLEVRLDAASTAVGHVAPVRLLPVALEGLGEGSDHVSDAAVLLATLGKTGNRELIPPLLDAARHGNKEQVRQALENLALFQPRPREALPLLQQRLDDPDPELRRSAAAILSRYLAEAQPAVPRLTRLLSDPSDDVREAAATTIDIIGKYTSPQVSAIPALIKAFETTRTPHARMVIAETLGFMGPAAKAAIPALTREIDNPDLLLRRAVRGTLADLQPPH
jgi:HEAT repeat protein